MLCLPAVAAATIYCVPDLAVDGTCQTAHADLQSALNAADANAGNDTVRLGMGTFTAATSAGFTYLTGNGNVSIIGKGEAQTTVTVPPDVGGVFSVNNVFLIDGSGGGSSISDLTVSIPTPGGGPDASDQYRAVEVTTGTIDQVTVTAAATPTNGYGFWLNGATTTLDDTTVNFPSPGAQNAVITNGTAAVAIEDSNLTALAPVYLRTAGSVNTIKRTRITSLGSYGVDIERGTLNLESSLIDLGSIATTGARSGGSAGAAETAALNLDHATIVGTNASATGVQVQASDATAADTRTATITNTVISGPGTPIRRNADQMDSANVTTRYSNYNAAGNVSSNGTTGSGTLVQNSQTNHPPNFVSPGTGDYHLLGTSLLIDAGDPADPAVGALDIDGGMRKVHGKDGCPRRDIGADEFVPGAPPAVLDCMPPDTGLMSGPMSPTNDTTPTFSFTSTEAPPDFECNLDGAGFADCASPFTTPALGDGSHTLEVQALDATLNPDPTPLSVMFTVDATPPDTSISSGPSGPTNDSTPSFGFTSTESPMTFECSVDGGGFGSCPSPFTPAALADGPHTFAVRAVDAATNTDASPATRNFTVDTAAPDTTITGKTKVKSKKKTARASLTLGSEAGATLECSLDGAGFAPCTSPFGAKLRRGAHTLTARAKDAVGNVDVTPAIFSFRIVKKKVRKK